jgi:hypothetical protein
MKTMPRFAYERARKQESLAGVLVVPADTPIREAIDDLVLVITCSDQAEWENRVEFLPL